MADSHGRSLQDILGASSSSRPADRASPGDVTTASESEDMDYEATSDDASADINDPEYIEAILRGANRDYEEDDDNDEDDEEDDEDGPYGELQVEIEEEDDDQDATQSEAERSEPPYILTFILTVLLIFRIAAARQRRQVIRLLATSELGRLFRFAHDDDEFDIDDEDGEYGPMWRRRRRRPPADPTRFPKVPSDEGTELMNSGTFGSNEEESVNLSERGSMGKKKKLARRILDRELATDSHAKQRLNQRLMAQGMIPASNPDMVIHYNQPVYSGQFSDDGNFFYSVNKDYKVRMYDTSNPYKWRYYKTVEYPFGQWTLTDASLSPDNKYLAYTSIRSTVCLAPTDPNDQGDPYSLDLADTGRQHSDMYRARFGGSFGIWSIRFSGDGRELVAGASGGAIVVYDIESRRTTQKINGHDDDVNAVCFADKSSPHILYSGSDDTTLKVWDTRSMGDSRAAGAFVGHIEGLTYIDSKGDGRYILSNGKEQSMKLWDLRMVMSPSDFTSLRPSRRTLEPRFDYRWGAYDEDDWYKDPNDNSLVTFRGHRVLRTLIRCHFSSPDSTNSRYVYSGSEDGKIYIWNMDATIAGIVDVQGATKNTRPHHNEYGALAWNGIEDNSQTHWRTCVRDASWHPNAPMIVASAWSGYGMNTGTCSVHSWNDGAEEDEAEPKMGLRVNQKLEVDPGLYPGQQERRYGLRHRHLGAYDNDD
ncbi:LEC14B protein [Lachnellula arida]|uniref:LEC14B protein n=1 Tax=Lachnellula arida TaxID=1316785 RepID=A0A8T9BTE5_9HELO|nr:LEC14B protein [Lachnellula arida]